MVDLDKVRLTIDKFNDVNKLDAYITGIIETLEAEEAEELEEYVRDRKIEIEGDRNPSGLDYPMYDHTHFKVSSASWKELNPENLSYWSWLEKVALPRFWIQPRPELQHKLLAICAAINTNAIPPRNKSARKEMPVPLLYFYGQSGSGKTEGNFIISQSYPTERFQIIKAEATGTSLRNLCHQLCYRGFSDTTPGYNNLYPAFLLIDNYEPEFLYRWGEFKTVLLSVLRTQSFTTTANLDRTNDYYFTHLLKSFTSVIPPKAMNTAQSEFGRRFIYYFTEKSEDIQSIAKYDFTDVPSIYADTWNLQNVNARWYPILVNLLNRDDNESSIPSGRWSQSMCIIATGVFIGLFQSVEEGIEFMTEYWQWVATLEMDMTNEVATLLDNMCDSAVSQWSKTALSSPEPDEETSVNKLPHITVSDLDKRIRNGVLDKRNALKDAKNYLTNIKGWIYGLDRANGKVDPVYHLPLSECYKILDRLED